MTNPDVLTGSALRIYREAAGLTQAELARRAGFSRYAVIYWEAKEVIRMREAAPKAFCRVLGLLVFSSPMGARG